MNWGHAGFPRGRVPSDANGLAVAVGVPAGNTHGSKGLKPMVAGHHSSGILVPGLPLFVVRVWRRMLK
jgi:hypothetical protein